MKCPLVIALKDFLPSVIDVRDAPLVLSSSEV